MGLGLFLVSTLGGYWFLTHLHFTRYAALRDSGYHVFFRAAIAGGILAGVAHLLVLPLNYFLPRVDPASQSYASIPYSPRAILLSAFLGFVLPFVGNCLYSKEKAVRRSDERAGNLIELLVAESIEHQKLVEISLRNRKVYVGFALNSGVVGHGESDIELVPMASGYRDGDTQDLEITTNYAPVIWESLEGSSRLAYEDFRVVIPMTEIISARIFLPEAYELFQQEELFNNQTSRTDHLRR